MGQSGVLLIRTEMISIFSAYLPEAELWDLLPVCVSSLSLLGNGVSSATKRPWLRRAAVLLLLCLRRRLNIVCVERLCSTSYRPEERTLNVTPKTLLFYPRDLRVLEIGPPFRREKFSAFQCRRLTNRAEHLLLLSVRRIQSQNQSYFTTGGLPPISSSWRRAPWDSRPEFFFLNWTPALIVLI
jgi:hypothetical protein